MVGFSEEAFDYLERTWYGSRGVPRSACHPRDLIDHIVVSSNYYGNAPRLTPETLEAACSDYFVPV